MFCAHIYIKCSDCVSIPKDFSNLSTLHPTLTLGVVNSNYQTGFMQQVLIVGFRDWFTFRSQCVKEVK